MIPCVKTEIVSRAILGETNNLEVATKEKWFVLPHDVAERNWAVQIIYHDIDRKDWGFLEINLADGEKGLNRK